MEKEEEEVEEGIVFADTRRQNSPLTTLTGPTGRLTYEAGGMFRRRLSALWPRGCLGVSKSVTCARSAFSTIARIDPP